MKKPLLLLSLLISSNLFAVESEVLRFQRHGNAVESEVSSSFESTWNKVLQVLMTEGAMIGLSDKTSGVIQASKVHRRSRNELRSYYGDSCNPGGKFISITSNILAVVKEVNSDRSKIIISGRGVIESYRNKHIFFVPIGTVDYITHCVSNGRLEDEFLTSFSKF